MCDARRHHYHAYDPEKPWLVVGREHLWVELDEDASFFEWAHSRWPSLAGPSNWIRSSLAPAWSVSARLIWSWSGSRFSHRCDRRAPWCSVRLGRFARGVS